jgi:hypothetical protein
MVAEVQNDFYIHKDGAQYGPYQRSLFESLIFEGRVGADDMYWRPGLAEWEAVSAYKLTKANGGKGGGKLLPAILTIVSEPYRLMTTLLSLIVRPSEFALSHIDNGPQSLRNAIKFFVEIFTIQFILIGALAHFVMDKAIVSEWRILLNLLLQFAVAIPLIYVLSVCFRQRAKFKGVAEAAFYIDAPFQLVTIVFLFIPAYNSLVLASVGQVDLIMTHFNKCYAEQSSVYWLLVGAVEQTFPSVGENTVTLTSWLEESAGLIVTLPFCFLFGHLLMKRYGDLRILHAALAALGFVVVTVGSALAHDFVHDSAVSSTNCYSSVRRLLKSTYSPTTLAEQAALHVDVELKLLSKQGEPLGSAEYSRGFVLLKLPVSKDTDVLPMYERLKKTYCSEEGSLWAARYLDVPVSISPEIMGQELKFKQRIISPKDC